MSRHPLDAVVAYAEHRCDVPALESYSVVSEAGRVNISFAYVGATALFEAGALPTSPVRSARA